MGAARFALLFTGPDSVLNDIYWTQHMKKQKEGKQAELSAIKNLVDPSERDLATKLANSLPTLDEALSRLQCAGEAGHVDAVEQQRLITRLGKVVKRMDDTKKKRRELEIANQANELARRQQELNTAQQRKEAEEAKRRAEYQRYKAELQQEPTG